MQFWHHPFQNLRQKPIEILNKYQLYDVLKQVHTLIVQTVQHEIVLYAIVGHCSKMAS